MGKPALTKTEVSKIRKLRKTGHSLKEIKIITNKGYGTVSRYVQGVVVLAKYHSLLKAKQGGSKVRSDNQWSDARKKAKELLSDFRLKDRMVILACLYWGEGNKTELNLVNSDPYLIRTILRCLSDLGVTNEELKVTLRIFKDINEQDAIVFWSTTLNIPISLIKSVNVLKGKKVGKLKYGMCRIRVKKGGKHFKLIMSMIDLIRSEVK
jgi:hypothetical protein